MKTLLLSAGKENTIFKYGKSEKVTFFNLNKNLDFFQMSTNQWLGIGYAVASQRTVSDIYVYSSHYVGILCILCIPEYVNRNACEKGPGRTGLHDWESSLSWLQTIKLQWQS